MPELVALLTLRAEIDVAIERIMAFGPMLVRPTLPGGRNAGDLLVRMTFDGAAPSADFGLGSAIAQSDGAIFESIDGAGDPCASPIHRTALFHAGREPTPDRLARFEAETIAMPRRMAFIRGWSLGAVTRAWGRFAWSHVWEQGYDTLEDLTGRYMRHPCHWGQVDRWFDPEHPNWLIDPGLCHAFCRTGDPA
jgi:hypothetical protein